MNNTPTISVIVPMFCEEDNVLALFSALQETMQSINESFEVLFVDDGSHDGTWEKIAYVVKKNQAFKGIRLSRNYGKEAALRAGLDTAQGRALIFMDGDMQHPPAIIPQMVNLWRDSGVQIVEAVKRQRGNENFINTLLVKMFYLFFARLTGCDLEMASDFKLLDQKAVGGLRRMKERNLFFRGMSSWIGFSRVKICFDVPDRSFGQTKWSLLRLFRLGTTAITSFTSAPLHLITSMGLLFGVFSSFLTIIVLYQKITGVAIEGFTTVILVLLIVGSVLMFGLGIIGEYLARIYEEIKGRPHYLIEESVSLNHNDKNFYS